MSSFGTHQFAPVTSYDDLCKQPGHLPKFRPDEDKVVAVLYHYRFPVQCQCGISSCGKFHNEGYVVQLESHLISQIGHLCWKNKFEEIGDIINSYQEARERPRLLHQLIQHKVACSSHRSFIAGLKVELQPLVEMKNNFKHLYPRLFSELERKGDLGENYKVSREREIVKDGNHIYTQEVVGTVLGCEFIRNSVLPLLSEVEQTVAVVEKASLIDISFSKLYAITLEAARIDSMVAKAQSLLGAGREFFSDESAGAIRKIEITDAVKQEARNFDLKKLEGGLASRTAHIPKKPNRAQRRGRMIPKWN